MVVVTAVIVAAAFVALLWRGAPGLDAGRLRGLTPVQRESAIDSIRGRLLQLGAGLVIAGGLVYTGLTFRLNREGQVTDRYTKAIEQLGHETLDVRLGAIYALERIMIDSERDHPTIVEVLAAYVREHAPLGEEPASDDETELKFIRPRGPATDVQAALTVLVRRPSGRAERGFLDLQRTGLRGADLSRADLSGAILNLADLSGADLTGANLSMAGLVGVDLTDAMLSRADLSGATLAEAILIRAHLFGANLSGALLLMANLDGAHLTGADLSGVSLASTMGTPVMTEPGPGPLPPGP